jgi:tetratricopeptide (TPR) repeat protein
VAFKIIKKGDANDEDLTKYAEILKSLERYSEAKDIYRQLANKYPDKKEFALKEEEKLIQVLQWLKEDALYEVNTVPNINTEYAEFGIINFKDNKVLFSTDRIEPNQSLSQRDMYGWTGNNFVKMYSADINKNGDLENYKLLEGITQDFHNSPGYFDQNTNTSLFYKDKTC